MYAVGRRVETGLSVLRGQDDSCVACGREAKKSKMERMHRKRGLLAVCWCILSLGAARRVPVSMVGFPQEKRQMLGTLASWMGSSECCSVAGRNLKVDHMVLRWSIVGYSVCCDDE